MPKPLPLHLAKLQEQVESAARQYGLDGFRCCYEMLDFDEINMVASYMGFPVRYPHWKWGMEYERLSKSFDYGLSRIYELVINNDPCYAYLLESNSDVDQKLVMCHVSAHNDFFKNNSTFAHTNRHMIDEMANHASRIRRYMDQYGVDVVEDFVDKILSLENLIDPNSLFIARSKAEPQEEEVGHLGSERVGRIRTDKEYMEGFVNPDDFLAAQRREHEKKQAMAEKFPREKARDVLAFLRDYAPLKRWQREVVTMLREEAYYFAPQAMTKIMNEGWASYWHAKLMTESVMTSAEVIDFADRHSSVVQMSKTQLNPYKLGMELFRDIEERWNKGQFGLQWENCSNMAERRSWDLKLGLGRSKIFEVRNIYSDVTFIDEFFTLDFCRRQGFFTYEFDKKRQEYVIDSRDFLKIKQKLLGQMTNLGQPQISVTDANFENKGELLLMHDHEGVDLDATFTEATLQNLARVWSRPVHILTKQDERSIMLSCDGEKTKETLLNKPRA